MIEKHFASGTPDELHMQTSLCGRHVNSSIVVNQINKTTCKHCLDIRNKLIDEIKEAMEDGWLSLNDVKIARREMLIEKVMNA